MSKAWHWTGTARLEGGIHHVGATAVPGLAAKPIVDVVAGVRDLEEARGAYAAVQEHGYVHTPHRPGIAHHFTKPSQRLAELTHGLHLTEPGSDLWHERLASATRSARIPTSSPSTPS